MARGFLKTVGAAKRMRFVKPGYNANDMNTPDNAVIFDSADIGNLSLYTEGEWNSGVTQQPNVILDDVQIVSWPTLPFVPLVNTQYLYGQGPAGTVIQAWMPFMDNMLPYHFRLWATPSGLNVYWRRDGSASIPSIIYIKYQVFRIPT